MSDAEKASPFLETLLKRALVAAGIAAVGAIGGNVGSANVVDEKAATAAEVAQLRTELQGVRADVTAVRTAVDTLAATVIKRIDGKGGAFTTVAPAASPGSPP